MHYENLPIFKSAMELCVYVEQIVAHFTRYHKYTLGSELRQLSHELLFQIGRANSESDKAPALKLLRDRCESLKMLVWLAKEIKAFQGFKQFEHLSKLIVSVCKQTQSWLAHYEPGLKSQQPSAGIRR